MLPESKLTAAKTTVYFWKRRTIGVSTAVCMLINAVMQYEYQDD
ncbi:hypothetical protein B0G80_8473 [Paraburkholderia sp. BL6669N2]|nr:hypothetical protein B0G80_8473 [Paraburkholderia sp. BL6669N2]